MKKFTISVEDFAKDVRSLPSSIAERDNLKLECGISELRAAMKRAYRFAYSMSSLRRHARNGWLPGRKSAGRWLIDVDEMYPDFRPHEQRSHYVALIKAAIVEGRA